LTEEFSHHAVKTVSEMGWAGLKNGELLYKAQEHFDVFMTTDRNLSFQQNLTQYDIAILVLCPLSDKFSDVLTILPKALEQLTNLEPGKATLIKN
jgi:hypothetical protein